MISIYTQKTKMNKKKLTFFELWHKQTAAEHSIKFKLQKKQTREKKAILTKQVWYKLITVCQQLDWKSKRSTQSESGRSVWGPRRCHETRGPQSQIRQLLEQERTWQTNRSSDRLKHAGQAGIWGRLTTMAVLHRSLKVILPVIALVLEVDNNCLGLWSLFTGM